MDTPEGITGHIYLITNLVNGKRYVGCTVCSIKKRWGEHRSIAKTSKTLALSRAIRKYGEDKFSIECIETVIGLRSDLLAAEVRQISIYDCVVPKGYNMTSGGEGVDLSVPGVRERMIAGARKRSSNPKWRRNMAEAALRRASDPACQENLIAGCRKRSADPVYRKTLSEAIAKRSKDPNWRESMLRGALTRLDSSDWREANRKQLERQHADPEWQKARAEGLRKAWELASAKAAARDAHLPPEEQARRARRREQNRRYAAEKRARAKAAAPTP